MSKKLALIAVLLLVPSLAFGWNVAMRGGSDKTYLMDDEFTTDRTAAALDADNTPMEVQAGYTATANGVRTVLDAEDKLTIASQKLTVAGGKATPAWGDPGVVFPAVVSGASRRIGTVQANEVTVSETVSPMRGAVGITAATSGLYAATTDGFVQFGATGIPLALQTGNGVNQVSLTAFSYNTSYTVYFNVRSSGFYTFMKGGAFGTSPLLVSISSAGTDAALYPRIMNHSLPFTSDYLRIPTQLWFPTPLAYAAFASDMVSTDIVGPDSQAAPARSWSKAGTWGVAGGVASCSALSGGIGIATVDTGTAAAITDLSVTRAAGTGGMIVRYVDADNYVRAIHDGTNCKLIKRVGGVEADSIAGVAAYSAGAVIRVLATSSTDFELYYNNAAVGGSTTVLTGGDLTTTPALGTSGKQGIYTDNTGNSFDAFISFPRGTNGEYAALNNM